MAETELQPAPSLFFRPPWSSDLDRVAALEAAGYPPDEAASRERLEFRIQSANGQFLVALRAGHGGDTLVGFVCGTLTTADHLTHASMATHEPEGSLLCIHSVCVAADERRQGVASALLRAYLAYVQQTTPQLTEVRLICKEPLVPLYAGVGFQLVGPSPVEHGQDSWLEMRMEVDALAGEGAGGAAAAGEAGG